MLIPSRGRGINNREGLSKMAHRSYILQIRIKKISGGPRIFKGRQPQRGRYPIISHNFCPKLHENEKIGQFLDPLLKYRAKISIFQVLVEFRV